MTRLVRLRPVYFVVPILLLFFGLALDSMILDSPTMDEQNHMARGIAFLESGDPRFSLEHPPLVNVINALPLLTLSSLNVPFDHPSWNQPQGWYAFAEQFLWVANHDVTRMVFLARIPTLFVTMALGVICYRLACQIWNRNAGLVSLTLVLLDPNIIAHGRYVTTDVGGTTFLMLAVFLLWRLWNTSGWKWGPILFASIGLGLALGSKMSVLVFIPIFGVMSLLPLYEGGKSFRDSLRRLIQFGVAGLGSVLVIWALYAFEWHAYNFQTAVLAFLNGKGGPLPTYLAGIEQILLISGGGRPSFLLGQFATEGWWYYFPIAFLVKTPILVQLMFILTCIFLIRNRRSRRRAWFLLLPVLGFFLVSVFSSLNIGYRHLLPILPFLYIFVSGIVLLPGFNHRTLLKANYSSYIIVVLIASVLLVDVLIHPHYLSYFNVIGGGPRNGYKVLVDSNIDWGQDLRRLKKWMDENEVESIHLSYFGTADPAYYGIPYEPLPGLTRHFDLWWNVPFDPQAPEPGIYAISVSNLQELPLAEKVVFPWFREREPDDRIGYSIFIYYVGDDIT